MESRRKRAALITGGASGIGRALARQLAGMGVTVVIGDINAEAAQQTAAEIVQADGSATAALLDVSDPRAVAALITTLDDQFCGLDYLFNNAGVSMVSEVRDMELADWNRLIDINLRGVIHGVQAAYPLMVARGFGHIVNTASIAGLAPFALSTGYNMTKHALVGLSLSLRFEARWLGVKVSVVCPGFIDTPLKDTLIYRKYDKQAAQQALPFKLHSVDQCAGEILRGVRRNDAVIVVTPQAKLIWWLYRMVPKTFIRINTLAVKKSRHMREERKMSP